MNLQKMIATALSAVLIGALLPACVSAPPADSAPSAASVPSSSVPETTTPPPASPKGEIIFQTWTVEAKEVIEKQIAAFNKIYPDVKITLEILAYDNYWGKMPIAIAGGAGPDLFIMTRPNFETFAKAGQVADITAEIAASDKLRANIAEVDPVLIDTYKFHGQQMGLPMSLESTGIIFNKTLLEKEGLPFPDTIEDTWTWDTLKEYAVKLTKQEGGVTTQYGYQVPAHRMPTLEYLWSNGAELFDATGETCTLASEAGIEAISFLNDLMVNQKVSPSIAFAQTQTGDDLFLSGKIAMMSVGMWTMGKFAEIKDFEWDVAQMPISPKTGKRYASSNVMGYMVGPNTKVKPEVILFLEYLTSAEGQKLYSENKLYIPVNAKVQSLYFESKQPANLIAFQKALSYAKPMAFSEYVPYQQFLSIFNGALTNIYNQTGDVTTEWKKAEDELNAVIAENKAK